MRKNIITLLELLHGVLIAVALLPLIALIGYTTGTISTIEEAFPVVLLTLLPVVVTFIGANYLRTLFTFVLVSVLSCVPLIFAPTPILLRVLMILLCIGFMITRMIGRVKDYDVLATPSPWALAVFLLTFFLYEFKEVSLGQTISYDTAFAYVLLLVLYCNLTSLEEHLEVSKDLANIPRKQISRIDSGAIVLLMAVFAIGMVLGPLLGLDQVIHGIGLLFILVLRFLFSLIQGDSGNEEDLKKSTESLEDFFSSLSEGGEGSAFWEILFNILTVIVLILLAVFALYLIAQLIISLIRRFYRPYNDAADHQEFLKETDEKTFLFREIIQNRFQSWNRSAESSIRRLYKKLILKNAKKDALHPSMSPTELEDLASIDDSDSRMKIHALYEKARYSGTEMSKDDIEKMKASIKKVSK